MTRRILALCVVAALGCGEAEERGAGTDEGGEAPPADGEADPADEECPPAPDTAVPLLTMTGGLAIRWPLERGCLDVTYTPAAAEFGGQITEAVAAWAAVECSRLCFSAAREVTAAEDTAAADADLISERQRIRFTATAGGMTARPETDPHSGEILTAHIALPTGGVLAPGALTTAVGLVLGLGRPTAAGVDSVMHQTAAAASPTATDAEALCALYGTPGYCQD